MKAHLKFNSKYAVTGSKMMRPGTPYIFSVTNFGVARAGSFYLKVFIKRRNDKENLVRKIFKMKSGQMTLMNAFLMKCQKQVKVSFLIVIQK